jgi:hypothetical protein
MRTLTLLILTCLACVQAADRPLEEWESERCEELSNEHAPLAHYLMDNFPPAESFSFHPDFQVEVHSSSLLNVVFTITNLSSEAVRHSGYAPGSILAELQHRVDGAWEFDWGGSMHCGMGLGTHVLNPGESATLYVLRNAAFDSRGVERMVGCATGTEYLIATPAVPRHVCTADCP